MFVIDRRYERGNLRFRVVYRNETSLQQNEQIFFLSHERGAPWGNDVASNFDRPEEFSETKPLAIGCRSDSLLQIMC